MFTAASKRLAMNNLVPLSIRIEDWQESKTNPQIDHIHALIRSFAAWTRENSPTPRTFEQQKVIMKFILGFTKIVDVPGKGPMEVPRSFGNAKKPEMIEMIESLIAMAVQWNVPIQEKG